MKKSIILQSLAMMAMFSDSALHSYEPKPKKHSFKKDITPKIPVSLKEYWFDYFGNFSNEPLLEYSFKCFALNDKNAIRKFKSYFHVVT